MPWRIFDDDARNVKRRVLKSLMMKRSMRMILPTTMVERAATQTIVVNDARIHPKPDPLARQDALKKPMRIMIKAKVTTQGSVLLETVTNLNRKMMGKRLKTSLMLPPRYLNSSPSDHHYRRHDTAQEEVISGLLLVWIMMRVMKKSRSLGCIMVIRNWNSLKTVIVIEEENYYISIDFHN